MNIHSNQSFIKNIFYFSIINIILQFGILGFCGLNINNSCYFKTHKMNSSIITSVSLIQSNVSFITSNHSAISQDTINNSAIFELNYTHSLLHLPYPYYLKTKIYNSSQSIMPWKKAKPNTNLKYIKGRLMITLCFLLYFI